MEEVPSSQMTLIVLGRKEKDKPEWTLYNKQEY